MTPMMGFSFLFLACLDYSGVQVGDEDCARDWYRDADGDGFGEEEGAIRTCRPPDRHVEQAGDCDDGQASTYPGAPETCDDLDDDCDGLVDEADPDLARPTWYPDLDGDGFGGSESGYVGCEPPSSLYVASGTDCDDADPGRNPAVPEVCNGVDDDCDDQVDDADPDLDAASGSPVYRDGDGDGHPGPQADGWSCAPTPEGEDCDDGDATVHPGAPELCDNGVDDDCDGVMDGCQVRLAAAVNAERPGWQNRQTWFWNEDGDLCQGNVTMALTEYALCYADSEAELRCSGRVGTLDLGNAFDRVGVSDVRQIFLSNAIWGEGLCVLSGETVQCIGSANSRGQFGAGSTAHAEDWVTWDGGRPLQAMATGTWDDLLTLDLEGQVWRSTSTGVARGWDDPVPFFMVDTFGRVQVDTSTLWRAGDGRADCFVTSVGITCAYVSGTLGVGGQIVVGNQAGDSRHCMLLDDGTSWCAPTPDNIFESSFQVFRDIQAVWLALDSYSQDLCAVANDGSLWCFGPDRGRFGGQDLERETQILPPGTFSMACE